MLQKIWSTLVKALPSLFFFSGVMFFFVLLFANLPVSSSIGFLVQSSIFIFGCLLFGFLTIDQVAKTYGGVRK